MTISITELLTELHRHHRRGGVRAQRGDRACSADPRSQQCGAWRQLLGGASSKFARAAS